MKTRFCPSPTGKMHLGNARTALFNALLSIKTAGTLLLRIEDTDIERSKQEYDEQLQMDLKWLGIQWQEGPHIGGKASPYYQSQRQGLYDKYYDQLLKNNLAYPCFCSEQQLALFRKLQRAKGKPPRYAGTCSSLSVEEVTERINKGEQPTLRFRVPDNEKVKFTDIVKGEQQFATDDLGDFIIRRANGTASFMFCNAIDDAVMEVTHVLRGEDHLTNTPRQLLILQALNLTPPQYGHISLITGSDGAPLSKRHGSKSLAELHATGFLPQALLNYLARLGHSYEQNNCYELEALAHHFDCSHLSKSPACFDYNQLLFWQKEALHLLSLEEFTAWLGEALLNQVPKAQRNEFVELIRPNILFPQEALPWITILYNDLLNYSEEVKVILNTAGIAFFEAAYTAVEQQDTFPAITKQITALTAQKGKNLFMPLRLALTGQQEGPELKPLIQLLGKEKCMQRLQSVIQMIG